MSSWRASGATAFVTSMLPLPSCRRVPSAGRARSLRCGQSRPIVTTSSARRRPSSGASVSSLPFKRRSGPAGSSPSSAPEASARRGLATEVGLCLADAWPDGVWMVDLSSVVDGELVLPSIADALGIATRDSGAARRRPRRADATPDAVGARQLRAGRRGVRRSWPRPARPAAPTSASWRRVGSRSACAGRRCTGCRPLPVTEDAVDLFVARPTWPPAGRRARPRPSPCADLQPARRHAPRHRTGGVAMRRPVRRQEIHDGLDQRFRLLRQRRSRRSRAPAHDDQPAGLELRPARQARADGVRTTRRASPAPLGSMPPSAIAPPGDSTVSTSLTSSGPWPTSRW